MRESVAILKLGKESSYIALIFVGILLVYAVGTTATFLLDDFGTLVALGNWGRLDNWDKWVNYVLSAYSGPNGRLLAVATFTLNAQTWPASPFWFLVTNVVIHAVNSILLYCFLSKLLGFLNIPKSNSFAFLAAAIWAFSPLHVSTVLYVVQRMAQLELAFNLIALISYLYSRTALSCFKFSKGVAWLAVSGIAAVAALFCKETALLIPLQLVLIEFFLGASKRGPLWPNKYWRFVVVFLPALVLFCLMANKLYSYFGSQLLMERRGFSVQERLLTELRVVGDYLAYFFSPRVQTAGVFHDGYMLSRGLFQPLSTAVWAFLHASLLVVAFVYRRHLPVITFGILWFYGNHLLESVVVQLEIKYEHRNYLPSIGLALIVACGLVNLPLSKCVKRVFVSVIVLALAGVTYARASLWGNPDKAVLVWMDKNPASDRALETAILHYSQKPGNSAIVNQLLKVGINRDSEDPVILLKALSYDCDLLANQYSPIDIVNLLSKSKIHWQMSALLEGVLSSISSGHCDLVSKSDFQAMLSAVKENPAFRKTRIHWGLEDLKAKSEFLLGDKSLAIKHYRDLKWREGMLGMRMNQALFLASNNYQKAAADILETAIVSAGQEDQRLVEPAKDMLNRIMKDVKNDH